MEIRRSSEEIKEEVRRRLQQHNAEYMAEGKDYSCHIEQDGAVSAGIVAEAVGDTVEVEFLYVDKARRGGGLGSRLLRHVEAEAAKDGMRRVLLNTYSFQAPGFYAKVGYRRLFEITPCFDRHSQFFFVKELEEAGR